MLFRNLFRNFLSGFSRDFVSGKFVSGIVFENCFRYLDAPIKRVGSIETPIPFAKNLENMFLPKTKLYSEIRSVLNY